MTETVVNIDKFGISLDDILHRLGDNIDHRMPSIVSRGVRKSASVWRKEAGTLWPSGAGSREYKKHGKVYKTGMYSKAIRSHMLSKDPNSPSGEVGVPMMPGLAHLLENGHVKVGGGRTRAFPHVEKAAEKGFEYTLELAGKEIDEALYDL